MKQSSNKNMRKVIIRLYRQFDLDLIYLYETLNATGADIQHIIKSILRSLIHNEEPTDEALLTTRQLLYPATQDTVPLRFKLQYQLILHAVDDADIIEWIERITIGYRNTVIKSAIRSFIGEPCLFPCLATTKLHFIDTRVFKEGD